MKDLHKQRLLDAKLEIGTEVQLFEFNFDKVVSYAMILAALTVVIWLTALIETSNLLSAYFGAKASLVAFYIKFGTN